MSRALLQQALDALTYQGTMGPTRRQRRHVAITALQAALAQPEPDLTPYGYAPGGYTLTCKTCGKTTDGADKRAYHCRECATRLAQPKPELLTDDPAHDDLTIAYMAGHHAGKTAKAKPLTDERVVEIRKECYGGRFGKQPSAQWGDSLRFARAIEAAHGIRPKGLFIDLIATHEGLAGELKAMDEPDWRPMTTTPFEDWYYDQCSNDAAEVVGPNSREYEYLVENYLDDTARREAALVRYRLETGDLSET